VGTFYALTCKTDCLQILYKFSKNWISVPNIVYQLTLSLCCKYCKIHSRSNFQDAINSIRRSAAERLQANDVSLLWRHSSWVRSRTLEHAYRRPFLTVSGKFEPQNVVGHRVDPQKSTSLRHNACFEPSCVKFHARVISVGVSGKKNKKERPYISRISPGAPLRPIGTKFGLRVHLVDAINCAKFYRNQLRGLDSVRGRSLTIPIGLRCRR